MKSSGCVLIIQCFTIYFRQHNYKLFEITATCFDFNQSSFRRAYEPLLVTICFCAFDFIQKSNLENHFAYPEFLSSGKYVE